MRCMSTYRNGKNKQRQNEQNAAAAGGILMDKKKYVAYVGTYTHGNSKGIHVYDVDVETGVLTERSVTPINNPFGCFNKHILQDLTSTVSIYILQPLANSFLTELA